MSDPVEFSHHTYFPQTLHHITHVHLLIPDETELAYSLEKEITTDLLICHLYSFKVITRMLLDGIAFHLYFLPFHYCV